MSCSMTAAVTPPSRTADVMVSMIRALSRVLTPLVGSSHSQPDG